MTTIERIKSNEVYKQIMADSFGGIMYDVANHDKYDTTELVELWETIEPSDREAAGGIVKGAMDFIYSVSTR